MENLQATWSNAVTPYLVVLFSVLAVFYMRMIFGYACHCFLFINELNNKLHRISDHIAWLEYRRKFDAYYKAMNSNGSEMTDEEYECHKYSGFDDGPWNKSEFFELCDKERARSAAWNVNYFKNRIFALWI